MNLETQQIPDVRARARTLDLDALARMRSRELSQLYADAPSPTAVDSLAGNPQGRMLAVERIERWAVARAVERFAGSELFVWGGKSFAGTGAHGTGSNRVHLAGRHLLFPFHTHVAPSRVDGRPAVLLDYDLPDNPWLIRQIHDEVREVDLGLWLGPAMWRGSARLVHVLWFALDTERPARPVGHGRT